MTPEEIAKKYGGSVVEDTVENYPDEIARKFGKDVYKPLKQEQDPDEIAKKYGGSLSPKSQAETQAEDIAAELLANTANQEAELLKEGKLPIWLKRQEAAQAEYEAYGEPGVGEIEMGGFAPALGAPAPRGLDPSREKVKLPETAWKELNENKEYKKIIKDYAVARYGESGKQGKDETDEQYITRWATSMRSTLLNSLDAVPELVWLKNAKEDDVKKASLAWQLWDTVPAFYEEGGQGGTRPVLESIASIATDPLNYVGFGAGSIAKYQIARGLIKSQINKVWKTAAASGGIGAAVGAASNIIQQDIEIQTGRKEELDTDEVLLNAALETLFTSTEAVGMIQGVGGPRKIKSTKEQLDEVLKGKLVDKTDEQKEKFLKVWDAELEKTLSEFDAFEGRQTLDKLSPPTEITEPQVKKAIHFQALKVAQYILLNDKNFADAAQRVANKEQKVSTAIKDVFMSLENQISKNGDYVIDNPTFEAALENAGISLKEFGEASLSSIGDAAELMAATSVVARIIRRAKGLDEASEKLIDRMYGKAGEADGAFSWLGNGIKRLERESKALVTSAIGTTVRNVMGTSLGLTFDAGARLVESFLFQTGKATKAGWDLTVNKKPYERGSLQKGLSNIIKDSLGTLVYMQNAGLTAEVADKILSSNPRIRSQLFKALQETGDADLFKVTQFVSSLGVAQDAFFRRAIFTASVERYTRRAGLDMYKILAENKRIPGQIIAKAAEDALIGTFSMMPKKGFGHAFVKVFEAPGMSLFNPFPRFMVNAVGFIYKYNPIISGARAASDFASSIKYSETTGKLAKKVGMTVKSNPVLAERLGGRALERFSQGFVGSAALLAAYNYRVENEDLKPNEIKNPDGSITDMTPVFPAAPLLWQGELIRLFIQDKWSDIKVMEALTALSGLKVPSGTQLGLIETLPELAKGILESYETRETEKLRQVWGRITGDFLTRFIQPAQPIFQFFELFSNEAQKARDPNVIESENIYSESLLNRIKNKLPIEAFPETADAMGVEPLPEAVTAFREGPPVRPAEFFTSLYGIRFSPERNKLEQEAKTLDIEPYKLYAPSGARTIDRQIMQTALPYVEDLVFERMDRDDYANLSKSEKKKAFTLAASEAISIAREEVLGEFMGSEQEKYFKFVFNNRPALDRRILNEAYARDNDGRTLEEDKAYAMQYEYEGALQLR